MNLVELGRALRQFPCSGMAGALDARLREAQIQKLEPIDFLSRLIQDELVRRQDRPLERRVKQAGFRDAGKPLDTFDFNRKMNRALVSELATACWVTGSRAGPCRAPVPGARPVARSRNPPRILASLERPHLARPSRRATCTRSGQQRPGIRRTRSWESPRVSSCRCSREGLGSCYFDARAHVVRQAPTQKEPRSVQTRLDRGQVDIQRLGNLGTREPFDVV